MAGSYGHVVEDDGQLSTNRVVTLTEFLLARIAEDEALTYRLVPYDCEPGCCAPSGFVGHQCLICGTTEFGGTVDAITQIAEEHEEQIHRRGRVIAECEAKRLIVDEHEASADPPEVCFCDGEAHPCPTVRALALPYAAHPDFDPAWSVTAAS